MEAFTISLSHACMHCTGMGKVWAFWLILGLVSHRMQVANDQFCAFPQYTARVSLEDKCTFSICLSMKPEYISFYIMQMQHNGGIEE